MTFYWYPAWRYWGYMPFIFIQIIVAFQAPICVQSLNPSNGTLKMGDPKLGFTSILRWWWNPRAVCFLVGSVAVCSSSLALNKTTMSCWP